jgi:hypothetical protein
MHPCWLFFLKGIMFGKGRILVVLEIMVIVAENKMSSALCRLFSKCYRGMQS